jgi:O-antigen/teichoic acid export membrane protein
LLEWVAAAIAALAGQGPLVATAALLATRVLGTVGMYVHMRRKVPWLSLGRPTARVHVRQRLTRPALAGAAIGWGTALNMQALLVLVSVVAGAASAAVFATVRAVSRIVVQVASAIGPTVGSEVARAYSSGDQELLRTLQRRVMQLGVWSALLMVGVLAFVGDWVVGLITRGTVEVEGPVLLILLAGAVFEVAWLTSGSILFSTNRHQRVGLIYTIASGAILGVAYLMVKAWGIDGAAWSVFVLSVLMLVVVTRDSLRATGDTAGARALSLLDPREVRHAIASVRPKA